MTTLRRVAGKLGALLLTLFLASLLVFFSRFLVPGDPISFLLRGRKPSPEAVAQVTAQYGLDLPPWQQYLNWLTGLLQGDLGRSLQYRQDVSQVIGDRLPVTLGLVVMADAPGRLPRTLRDRLQVVAGGYARTWTVPWIDTWRTSEVDLTAAPREVRRVVDELTALANTQQKG